MEFCELTRKTTCTACGAELSKEDVVLQFKTAKSNPTTVALCDNCCDEVKALLKENSVDNSGENIPVNDSSSDMNDIQINSRVKLI